MFEKEEYGIILEDDDVPAQSFFPFCKELLEKYKNNEKINMICGMNNTGVSDHINKSYLFTQKGSIWGWASWKRVIDTWDGEYKWTEDVEKRNTIKKNITQYHSLEEFLTYDDMSILAESKDLYLPKFSKRRNISFKLNELHKYPVLYTINDKTKYAGDYIHIEILIQLLGFVNPFATSDLMRILRTLLTDTEDLENLHKHKDGYFRLQECFKKVFNSESSSMEQNDIDDGASYIQSVDTGCVDDLIMI